ncbi:DUF3685 domain-containing protein [Trichothermofontia sp.]
MTDSPLKLVLVERDPIFRLGLRTWLTQFKDLDIQAEADSLATALATIARQMEQPIVAPATPMTADAAAIAQPLDLVIADFDLEGSQATPALGLQLCQQLHEQFPDLPVLLLSSKDDPARPAIARAAGAQGYCLKGMAERELVAVIRQVAAGEAVWPEIPAGETVPSLSPPTSPPTTLTWLDQVRLSWRQLGLQQIDAALADLNQQIETCPNPALTQWDRWVLRGRQRELRTARSLVDWLLPPVPLPPEWAGGAGLEQRTLPRSRSVSPGESESPIRSGAPSSSEVSPAWLTFATSDTGVTPADLRLVQTALFDAMFRKLQTNLQNLTDTPLEIDILRVEKRRELLSIILRKLEAILDELRFSQIQPEQLLAKRAIILRDLWTLATNDFFGRYYSLTIAGQETPVVSVLLRAAAQVEAAILDKIPGVGDALAHLLFRVPITVDNVAYGVGTPDAMSRMEALLENCVIAIANAVIYPLLNYFTDVEEIKQGFYDRRLLSSREIERFRNDLTWRYRIELWVGEPTAIFESSYRLFILSERGIKRISIYAPRREELEQLTGLQLAVTLILETRDALSPRLRSLVAFVGSGVVYLLTQVIGRGLGLIGRGILQGIGSSFQDTKLGRDAERQR